MRIRAAAASAALVLCTAAGAAACSSPPRAVDANRPANSTAPAPADGLTEDIETGRLRTGPPETDGGSARGSARCAVPAAEIPPECALDLRFAATDDGERAAAPPATP